MTLLARVWLVAAACVLLDYGLQADSGLGFEDEGYLWYGAWRVSEGEVPRLDFRGYDAPRNYWLAFWSVPFGEGPLGLRAGAAVFQWLGVGFGLLVVRRLSERLTVLIPAALVLTAWMYPRHKVFEHALALAAVWVATVFLESPGVRRAFISGFFVGLAGSFRRNHAVYTFVALGGLLLYSFRRSGNLDRRERGRLVGAFVLGVVIGFFPVWLLAALHPGYLSAYWESVTVILERGQTNQPLPVPWPWRPDEAVDPTLSGAIHRIAVGWAFVIFYALFIVVAIELWRHRTSSAARTVLLAAFCVGVPYAHHSMARSDVSHLCQSAPPMLLGIFALIGLMGARRQILAGAIVVLLVLFTASVPLYVQPRMTRIRQAESYLRSDVLGDRLWIRRDQAEVIEAARRLSSSRDAEARIFFAPMLPALYRILELPAPGWDPYPIWPPSPERGRQMVSSLENPQVRWAVIGRENVGGLHFWDSHPSAWAYLQAAFEPVEDSGFPAYYQVLRRRHHPDPAPDPAAP